MSDDQQHGLTLIAFVGSVFSPYYRWAHRKGRGDPENHCALNVALYGRGARRWTMTERGRRHCQRDSSRFEIGPSRLDWDGQCLHVRIDEVGVPLPRAVRGHIRIWPQQLFTQIETLDAAGRHRWGPIAPQARVEVDLEQPGLCWQGQAYIDSNEGDEPIDQGFDHWDWSRTLWPDGSTEVTYDMQWRDRPERLLRLRYRTDGEIEPLAPTPTQSLPRTAWGIARRMRSEEAVGVHEQLEDTPFYQRCLLARRVDQKPALAFHETLSIPRLVSPIVQGMLPFRMPRRA